MKRLVLLIALTLVPLAVHGQLSGGGFEIYDDTFSFVGGSSGASGGVYTLYETGGEYFAASSAGGDYILRGGFRAAEKGILQVDISTTSLVLGTLTTTTVVSDSVDITVSTDNFNGYTLYVSETAENPENGDSDTIADVVGGAVVAGTEAYGIEASGADAYLPGVDNAITSATNLAVAGSSGEVRLRLTTLTYKVAVSSTTDPGLYTHSITPIVLVNF